MGTFRAINLFSTSPAASSSRRDWAKVLGGAVNDLRDGLVEERQIPPPPPADDGGSREIFSAVSWDRSFASTILLASADRLLAICRR